MTHLDRLAAREQQLIEARRRAEKKREPYAAISALLEMIRREKGSSRIFRVDQRVIVDNPKHSYYGRTGRVTSILPIGGGVWDWAMCVSDDGRKFSVGFWDLKPE